MVPGSQALGGSHNAMPPLIFAGSGLPVEHISKYLLRAVRLSLPNLAGFHETGYDRIAPGSPVSARRRCHHRVPVAGPMIAHARYDEPDHIGRALPETPRHFNHGDGSVLVWIEPIRCQSESPELKPGRNRTAGKCPGAQGVRPLPSMCRDHDLWTLRVLDAGSEHGQLPRLSGGFDADFQRIASIEMPDFDGVDAVPA
jgi:hypothetical protein